MKGKILLIIIILLILAALTNPDASKHREAVKEEVRDQILTTTEENILTSVLGGFMIDQVMDQLVTVDNYLFFSLTRLNISGEHKLIGIGLFGNVLVNIDKEKDFKEWFK